MPNVKDCPGFETFGADVQQAREAVKMSRRELAEKVGIDPRYLANIELCGTIPSVPVVMQLIRICKLPAERYFNPELLREDSEQRQRTSHKLQLCPEKYLPIVEGVIDGAIKFEEIPPERAKIRGTRNRQAMQTYTCFAILVGLHRPKCLLRDNPQAPKIATFGDGYASCGR